MPPASSLKAPPFAYGAVPGASSSHLLGAHSGSSPNLNKKKHSFQECLE